MSRGAQLRVSRTRTIPKPNEYILALYGDYGAWCLDEEDSPQKKGRWRSEVFKVDESTPLDWEIGTGNGAHFANQAHADPRRALIGVELKYKPLIQSIRRAIRLGCQNARMIRYNAALVDQLFSAGEINNVYIHFPDPWERSRQHKHRLIQDEFLQKLFVAQRPGSQLEFKTDNRPYFDWAVAKFAASPYQMQDITYDLHEKGPAAENFITQFESIFIRQNLPIHRVRLLRPPVGTN